MRWQGQETMPQQRLLEKQRMGRNDEVELRMGMTFDTRDAIDRVGAACNDPGG